MKVYQVKVTWMLTPLGAQKFKEWLDDNPDMIFTPSFPTPQEGTIRVGADSYAQAEDIALSLVKDDNCVSQVHGIEELYVLDSFALSG